MPFREIAGHGRLLGLLSRAAARDSLPPSLIFAGPAGVGKRLAALALAQTLNCLAPVRLAWDGDHGQDACGTCAACRRIGRGVHADVLVIEPGETGSIKIEPVREVVEAAAYRPFEGRRRVVIVDEADALLPEAQNALLKTLEEPPAGSAFVLVTARPDLLRPTVRSRCPHLRFGRLSPAEIAGVLVRAHGYDERAARAAAAAADGSAGRALESGSDRLVAAREAASQLLEGAAAGADPRRRLAGARDLAARGQRGAAGDREELAVRLRALASLLRDLELLSVRADERLLANADLRPRLDRLAGRFDSDRLMRAFSAVDRALEALERNASPKTVADWLAFQL